MNFGPAGGLLYITDPWDPRYDGVENHAYVMPEGCAVPWTRVSVGAGAASSASGYLTLTSPSGTDTISYAFAMPTLANLTGAAMELRLQVSASSAADGTGLAIIIEDGDCQFVAWVRTDGVNIEGQDEYAIDMTCWRRICFVGRGVSCSLYIDGLLVNCGPLTALTAQSRVMVGSLAGHGYATALIDHMRARGMGSHEIVTEAWEIMTIGPYYYVITDLLVGADVLVDVDHTADANFSLAEYPVITDNAGNPFDPASVLVEILPETDGHSFALRVTNVAWVNDLGYGGGDPDIILKWYRTGYAPVT